MNTRQIFVSTLVLALFGTAYADCQSAMMAGGACGIVESGEQTFDAYCTEECQSEISDGACDEYIAATTQVLGSAHSTVTKLTLFSDAAFSTYVCSCYMNTDVAGACIDKSKKKKDEINGRGRHLLLSGNDGNSGRTVNTFSTTQACCDVFTVNDACMVETLPDYDFDLESKKIKPYCLDESNASESGADFQTPALALLVSAIVAVIYNV